MRAGNIRSTLDADPARLAGAVRRARRPVRQVAHPRRHRPTSRRRSATRSCGPARSRSMSPRATATPRFILPKKASRSRPATFPPACWSRRRSSPRRKSVKIDFREHPAEKLPYPGQQLRPRHLPRGGAPLQLAGVVHPRIGARAEDLRLPRADRQHGAGRSRRGARMDGHARAAARPEPRPLRHAQRVAQVVRRRRADRDEDRRSSRSSSPTSTGISTWPTRRRKTARRCSR